MEEKAFALELKPPRVTCLQYGRNPSNVKRWGTPARKRVFNLTEVTSLANFEADSRHQSSITTQNFTAAG